MHFWRNSLVFRATPESKRWEHVHHTHLFVNAVCVVGPLPPLLDEPRGVPGTRFGGASWK